jgi:protein-arginine kinase activator protein McsA
MENPYSGWQFESFALLRQGQLVPACKWEFIVCNRCAGNKVGRKINEIAIERMKAIESLTIDYMSNLTKVVSQMQVVSAV